jgi:hypothetical protein
MISGHFISIKSIADRLLMNPIMKDLNFEFIIDKTVECLRLVNMAPIYASKMEKITIKQYKGDLPLDLIYTEQVYYNDNGRLVPLDKGTDIIQEHYNNTAAQETTHTSITYNVSLSKINTNIESGELAIAYKAIAIDEECFPMIPDNIKLIRCIESYIKYRWFDILNDMDKVSDRKLSKAETDYCFNVAQAQSDLIMPDLAEMEEFTNSVRQILPNTNQFKERMKFLGSREYIKVN